jgi:hypothetical protein
LMPTSPFLSGSHRSTTISHQSPSPSATGPHPCNGILNRGAHDFTTAGEDFLHKIPFITRYFYYSIDDEWIFITRVPQIMKHNENNTSSDINGMLRKLTCVICTLKSKSSTPQDLF